MNGAKRVVSDGFWRKGGVEFKPAICETNRDYWVVVVRFGRGFI